MPWIPVPTAAGREMADLLHDLLPDIERDARLLGRYAESRDLRQLAFAEQRGRFSFLCRPFSYDLGVLEEIWDDGVYDHGLRSVPVGGTVIDVGAHGGYFTVRAAAHVGPRGRVLAIEPEPENLRLLREHIRRNRLRNVTVVPAAASARAGKAHLYLAPGLTGHSLSTRRSPYRRRVPRVTLAALARQHRLGDIALLKIDAENAEHAILRGAGPFLENVQTIIAACYHAPGEVQLVRGYLRGHGCVTKVRSGIVTAARRGGGR